MAVDKCVTVFGGSGLIGRYVVARLASEGWTVRVAVRRPVRARFLKPLGDVGQVVPLPCNVRNAEQVRSVLRGSQAAVNLVGILRAAGKQTFDAIHVDGARNVASAAQAEQLSSLVHVSAIGADADATSDYARTKGTAEQQVRELFPAATILRPSLVFGPEDNFFNLREHGTLSPFLPLIGGGKTRFSQYMRRRWMRWSGPSPGDCSGRTSAGRPQSL